MFFHKKKKNEPVPIEEVQKLTASGMSDKDVIKRLKSKGYSYEEIEKSMMSAVKRGVDEPAFGQQYSPQYQPYQQKEQKSLPEMPELSEYRPDEQGVVSGLQETMPEDFNTDVIVEEIVEGVVEEKLQKFEERIRRMESDYSTAAIQIKQLELRQPSKDQPAKDYDSRISEMSEQMEELQARIGGLEKAFKQFLPSLTKNIESLSGLIHEMKEKQGMVVREAFNP